jgi:hypothetical protein
MSRKFTIATLLAVIAAVVATVMISRDGDRIGFLRLKASPPSAHPAIAPSVRISPRNGRATVSRQQASKVVATYEAFKQQKKCFEILVESKSTSASILEEIADLEADMSRGSSSLMKDQMENAIRFKESQLSELKNCSEDHPITQNELSKMLEGAALQGDHAAQLAYAQNPMVDPFHAIDNLGRLKAWRERAIPYVNSAIDRGNSEAMVILAGAYDPFRCEASNEPICSGMLNDIIEPDAEKAFGYYYQSELAGDAPAWVKQELSALERILTETEIASAKLAAETRASNTLSP